MARDRDPKPLADLLPTLVAGRGWGERLALGRLREAWAEVVGPQVASRSEPVRLARGALTVRAEAGAWASELALLAPSIVQRADRYLGGGLVRELQVVTGAAPVAAAGAEEGANGPPPETSEGPREGVREGGSSGLARRGRTRAVREAENGP